MSNSNAIRPYKKFLVSWHCVYDFKKSLSFILLNLMSLLLQIVVERKDLSFTFIPILFYTILEYISMIYLFCYIVVWVVWKRPFSSMPLKVLFDFVENKNSISHTGHEQWEARWFFMWHCPYIGTVIILRKTTIF